MSPCDISLNASPYQCSSISRDVELRCARLQGCRDLEDIFRLDLKLRIVGLS